MAYFDSVKRAFNSYFLKRPAMSELANDEAATMHGFITLAIVGLAYGIIFAALFAFMLPEIRTMLPMLEPYLSVGPVVIIVAAIVLTIVGFFIGYSVTHLLAKLFGGTATGTQFFRAGANIMLPSFVASMISNVVGFVPILGSLVSIALGIWGVVVLVNVLMEVHKLSVGKAVAVVLIPIAIIFIIVMVFVFLMIASLLSSPGAA
jgi:hypothetical protein